MSFLTFVLLYLICGFIVAFLMFIDNGKYCDFMEPSANTTASWWGEFYNANRHLQLDADESYRRYEIFCEERKRDYRLNCSLIAGLFWFICLIWWIFAIIIYCLYNVGKYCRNGIHRLFLFSEKKLTKRVE